jgi:hypothetical protein
MNTPQPIVRIEKGFINRLAAFLLGLTVCGEIFTVYQTNNTYIELPHIYSASLFLLFIIKSPKNAVNVFNKYCVNSLKLFSAIVVILVVPGMWVFRNTSWFISPVKGLIMYGLLLTTFCDALLLRKYNKDIINGLLCGFSLNLTYSAVQYLLYSTGGNYVLLQGITLRTIQNIEGLFRAEGFFSEPSHYWLFLVCFFPLFLSRIKKEYLSSLIIVFVLFLFSVTVSGGIYAIAISCLLYLFFVKPKKVKTPLRLKTVKITDAVFGLLFLTAFLVCLWKVIPALESLRLSDYIDKSLSDIIVSDKSNGSTQQRFASMLAGISLISSYWYGVGYGMASPLILTVFENGINNGNQYYIVTFSYPITCCLETGILGLGAYLCSIYTLGIKLMLKNRVLQSRAISAGCLMCFIGQALTGRIIYPYMMLLFGLACIEYAEGKDKAPALSKSKDGRQAAANICCHY